MPARFVRFAVLGAVGLLSLAGCGSDANKDTHKTDAALPDAQTPDAPGSADTGVGTDASVDACPSISSSWTFEDTGIDGSAWDVTITPDGVIHAGIGLMYARRQDGVWSAESVFPGGGGRGSIAVAGDGTVHMSTGTNPDPFYARRTPTGWEVARGILPPTLSAVNAEAVLALDAADAPHMMINNGMGGCKLCWVRGAPDAWIVEDIGELGADGGGVSLVITDGDALHAIHRHYWDTRVIHSTNETGTWTHEELERSDRDAAVSAFRIRVGPASTLHAVYVIETSAGSLMKYATRRAGVWSIESVPAEVARRDVSFDFDVDGRGRPHVLFATSSADDRPRCSALQHVYREPAGDWRSTRVTDDGVPANHRKAISVRIVDDRIHALFGTFDPAPQHAERAVP